MEIEIDVSFYKKIFNRILKILPILLAIVVVGGFSYWLFINFNQVSSAVSSLHPNLNQVSSSISSFHPPAIKLPDNPFPTTAPTKTNTPTPTVTPVPTDSQKALVMGIEALCKVDYNEGLQSWSNRVCQVSSTDGCKYQYSIFGRNKWDDIVSKKITISSCLVVSNQQVSTMKSSRITDGQVWHVIVSGAEAIGLGDNYALVVYDPVAGWRFERLLYDVEVKQLGNGQQ